MKNTIERIVKFGVPFLVLLMMIYIQFFARHNGDAEFGAIGQDTGLAILLLSFIILYSIAGIIVRAVSKNNFIFMSAVFSIAVLIIYYIIMVSFARYDMAKEDKRVDEYIKNELVENQRKYDSLTNIIENSDNNSKIIEERALLYINEIFLYDTADNAVEKRTNHFKELEIAVENNTKNIDVYYNLDLYYLNRGKYETGIKMLEKALKTLPLSEKNRRYFEGSLYNFQMSKKEKIRRDKADAEWRKNEKAKNILLIKNLTEKFEKEGFNDKDLAKRGIAYRAVDKDNEALADFNKAIELNSKNRTAIVQKAHVLNDLERFDEAISQYKKCISKYPQNKKHFQHLINRINKNKIK